MICEACERNKFMDENPEVIMNLRAYAHTCDWPERLKRLDAEMRSDSTDLMGNHESPQK